MNREKFKQAIPVHERLVTVENKIQDRQAKRARLQKDLSDLNAEITTLNTERLAIYEEFKVI